LFAIRNAPANSTSFLEFFDLRSFFHDQSPVTEHRELAEVVFTAADILSGSSESKRAKVSETLLNILDGRVSNSNTYHVGMWLKRHTGSVVTQRQHLAAVRLLFDHLA
jgi:hypothetical protein